LTAVEIVNETEKVFGGKVFVDVFETWVTGGRFPTSLPAFAECCEILLPKGRDAEGERFAA